MGFSSAVMTATDNSPEIGSAGQAADADTTKMPPPTAQGNSNACQSNQEPPPVCDDVDFFDIPALRKRQEEERKAQEALDLDGLWASKWEAPLPVVEPEEELPSLELAMPPVVIPGSVEGTEVSIRGGCIVTIKHAEGGHWFFSYDRTAALVEFIDGQGRIWQRVGKDLLHQDLWQNDQGGQWSGQVQPLLDGRVLLRAGDGDWTELLADGIGSRYCPGPGLPVVESDGTGPCRIESTDLANTRVRLTNPDEEGFAQWMTGDCAVEWLRVFPRKASLWLERRDGVSLVYTNEGVRLEQPLRGPEDFEKLFSKALSRLDRDGDGYVHPADIDAAVLNPAFTGEEIQLLAALQKKTYRDGGVGIVKSLFDLAGTAERGALSMNDVRAFSRRLQYGLAGISVLDNEDVVEVLNEIRGWNAAAQGFIGRDVLQKLVVELRARHDAEMNSVATAIQELIKWMSGLGLQQTNSRDLRGRLLADVELYRAVQSAMHAAYDCLQHSDTPTSRRLYGDSGEWKTSITPECVKAGPESTNKFFLCSLASLAALAPEVIERMIAVDGTEFVVRFPGDKSVEVRVKAPVEAQLGLYGHGGRNGTWVTVLESAFAEYCKTGFTTEKMKCATQLSWYGDSLVAELLTASDAKILSRWYGQTNYMSTTYSAELQYKIHLMDRKALMHLIESNHTVVLSTNHPEIAGEEANQDLAVVAWTESEVKLVNPSHSNTEQYLSGPLPPNVYATMNGELVFRIEDLPKYFFRAVGCQLRTEDLNICQFLSKLKQKEA